MKQTLAINAGAPARCPLIAVKLNGATAAQKPYQHICIHSSSNPTTGLKTEVPEHLTIKFILMSVAFLRVRNRNFRLSGYSVN